MQGGNTPALAALARDTIVRIPCARANDATLTEEDRHSDDYEKW